nr:PREDICTED: zinc finger protein 609 [Apteryx mantelli mantelli]
MRLRLRKAFRKPPLHETPGSLISVLLLETLWAVVKPRQAVARSQIDATFLDSEPVVAAHLCPGQGYQLQGAQRATRGLRSLAGARGPCWGAAALRRLLGCMLVVNVTWRNKTYVGTLLDCTQHDWAPPRFCDSPTSDLEMRNGRGRGKRMRPNSNTPVNETATASDSKGTSNSSKTRAGANSKGRRGSQNSSDHRTPPSGTTEDVKASPSSVTKRKSKPLSDMELNSSSEDSKGSKRIRTNSMGSAAVPPATVKVEPAVLDRNCPSPILIDCPHPNCNKKYKHINGLKYHQAHAHTDDDSKLEADVDSEYGEEPSLHSDIGSCNGAAVSQKGSLSPARSATPKVRLMEPHSPSPSSKFSTKVPCKKKLGGEGDTDPGALSNDGSEDGPSVADETSNDGFDSLEKRCVDKDKSKKASAAKLEKIPSKSLKSARPIAPAIPPQPIYTFQTATFTAASPGSSTGLTTTVVQTMPNSPQLKPIQPKPTVMGEPFTVNPALTPSKEKKKKDKKKKEPKEVENPLTPGKACRAEEGKSPFRGESSDLGTKGEGLLNGSSDPHQSRLASIKAEADKIYSFTDNAPSPSIGGASRLENANPAQPMTPLHVVTQNGAEASSVKTNSPAYSDISDAGEDGEGKLESMKAKDPEQLVKEGAKKALFPPQPQSKESPYYQGFETYYSPGYPQASPGPLNPSSQAAAETQALKLKKDEEQENPEVKVKSEGCEEKKAELGSSSQQPSVIQQRPNMYMQSLYYNQYAYVPPYGYNEQGYHAHLLSTNPAYRQQYEEQQKQRQSLEQQQRGLEKKVELGLKEREAALKEEWKQKPPMPPTLTKAPSLTDLVKSGLSKAKEQGGADMAKSVIIPKLEDSSKLSGSQVAEGLKVKLSEASHLGKESAETKAGSECGRQAEVDPVLWYRQEAEPRMWTYVYPAKYSDIKTEDERWKEERDRKLKEERSRSKEAVSKEDGKESTSSECKLTPTEEARMVGKDPRPSVHVPVSSPLTQHQSYIPYMHGYSYSQSYDPNHPSYRAMPTVMMQNYPGSYLPSSYSFSPYGSKASGSDDSDKSRASPSVSCKSSSESKALDILQQHASHYKSKSPTVRVSPAPCSGFRKVPGSYGHAGLGEAAALTIHWFLQEAEPRMWTYVYPAKYSDIKTEDERWKEERDRKLKEERSRSKEAVSKEDGKESTSSECKLTPTEEARMVGKDPRPSVHVPVSSPLTQHQSYIPYMHGYSYSQSYDPNHPSYRAMPTVMMQNYPGSYLPSSYSFSPYGSKASGSDDSDKSRASPSVSCKSSSESKALDILQQHASHYKSKSPTISEKTSQERDRSGCGVVGGGGSCSSVGGAGGGERSADRPRTSPSQRLLSTHHHHHHLGYSLLPAQYNLPYATGLSSTAIVASQQGSAPSLYPPPRRT